MSLQHRIARDSLAVTALVLVARAVGLLVPLCVARWFGAEAATDAYYLVVGFPLMVIAVVQAALGSTLTPVFVRLRLEAPATLPAGLTTLLGLVAAGLSITAIGLLFALPPLLEHLWRDRPATAALSIDMLELLLPLLPLSGIALTLRSMVDAMQVFRRPALIPLLRGGVQIGGLALLHTPLGPMALPVSLLLAEAAHVAALLLLVRTLGIRFAWPTRLPAPLRTALVLAVPLAAGEAAVNLSPVIDRLFAARLGTGDLSALEYATRVMAIPETALSAGLLTVVFAHWSGALVGSGLEGIRQSFAQVARWMTRLLVPALIGLELLRHEVVQVLFRGGRFGIEAVGRTADVLEGYLPGFLPMMLAALAARFLLVQGRVGTVVRIGVIGLTVHIALDLLLVRPFGIVGLALATSLRQIGVAVLLLHAAGDGASLLGAGFVRWGGRLIIGYGALGLLLYGLLELAPLSPWLRIAVIGTVLGGAMLIEGMRAGLFKRPPPRWVPQDPSSD